MKRKIRLGDMVMDITAGKKEKNLSKKIYKELKDFFTEILGDCRGKKYRIKIIVDRILD